MNFFDFVIVPLIFLLGHIIIAQTVLRFDLVRYKTLLTQLFYYHIVFSLLFAWYVNSNGGDAIGYWKMTRLYQFMPTGSPLELHVSGTPFVYLLVYPLVKIFGLSYWSLTLLFSLVGFTGFIFLFLTISRTVQTTPKIFGIALFPLVLFLPNMHFWSGGIGKDTIIFFALCLFIFALTLPVKNIPALLFALYLAYMVRPHIALLMVVGMIFALATSTSGVSNFWRFTLLLTAIYIFVLISPSVLEFIGAEQSIDSFEDLSDVRSKNLSRGSVGSAIDISSYNTGAKILTFLFRPLFFDTNNIFGLVVSFENLFYVLLFIKALSSNFLRGLFSMPAFLKACLLILSAAAYFMSSSLSNLGIIIRQKNMVMFMFVLICLYLITQTPFKNSKARKLQVTDGKKPLA